MRALDAAANRGAELVAEANYNAALKLIHQTVETIITDPLYMSQLYGAPKLDALCAQIGDAALHDLPASQVPVDGYAYVATRLQRSGGHTRLLRDFILARPTEKHTILLTGLSGASDLGWLRNSLRDVSVEILQAPRGSFLTKLKWLQRSLRAVAPRHTYLFNHHQDVVAVAALSPALGLPASFCHHGDHHLCLGVHATHLTHLDFHPMGYHHCRDALQVENRYIPFTVPEGTLHRSAGFMEGPLMTATAGGANKIEQPYAISYMKVIPALMEATGGSHLHMGHLSRAAHTQLLNELLKRGIAPERFLYRPWVPSVWETLLAHRVDFYISSFPLGGGLSLVEAMGAGIPSTAHRHLFNRALSGFDLLYAGAFSWQDPDALIAYCAALTPKLLQEQSNAARIHYERYHAPKQLVAALAENAAPLVAPALQGDFTPVESAWSTWVAQQNTGMQRAKRFAWRYYRQLRRVLHG